MKYLYSLLSISIVLTCLSACKTTKSTNQLEGDPAQVLYMLKKGACFGRCPIYTLNIYADGRAEYIGEKFTKKLGTFEKRLKADEFAALAELFKASGFDKFETEYASNIPDLPMVRIGYALSDTLTVVKGKEERPAEVKKLQYALENIGESEGWLLISAANIDGVEEGKSLDIEPVVDKTKIVVTHKSGIKLPVWFNEMRNAYGVRIVEKVEDVETSTWVITYTTTAYTAEEVLEGIRANGDVESADFLKPE